MGAAARLNPRSPEGRKSDREVRLARLDRFLAFFQTREQYEAYMSRFKEGDISLEQFRFMESRMPERLKVKLDS